jgi:hypothetical protein
MPDTFHIAEADDNEGFALARLISRLGVEISHPSTFLWDRTTSLEDAWENWLKSSFEPHLGPAFVKVYEHASSFQLKEIRDVDALLEGSLAPLVKDRSRKAAHAFLEGKSEMKANREWQRFVDTVEKGQSPGHVTTLFALQCALYHLPLAASLSAYVWFELECGLPRDGYRDEPGSAEESLQVFRLALPQVAVALRGDRGEIGNDYPNLRAI